MLRARTAPPPVAAAAQDRLGSFGPSSFRVPASDQKKLLAVLHDENFLERPELVSADIMQVWRSHSTRKPPAHLWRQIRGRFTERDSKLPIPKPI